MPMRFSDLHVNLIAQGLLSPGEQLLARSVVEHQPWWSLKFPQFKTTYLVLATSHRLILVEHKVAFFTWAPYVHNVHAVPWGNVEAMKLKGLVAKTKLRIQAHSEGLMIGGQPAGPGRLIRGTFKIPGDFLGPIRANRQGAKTVVQAWDQAKSLAPGRPQPSALPFPA